MSSDEQKWWIAPPGMQPEGPFKISEIRSRVESAPKGTDWQVCMEGSVQWQPLTDLPAFAPSSEPTIEMPEKGASTASSVNNYLLLMHLSQLSMLVVPIVGLIVPIVMWQVKKDENELINRQGREITNWLIFLVIAWAVSALLAFFIIGIPLLVVLVVLAIVFPIIGAVKASSGEYYAYPMLFRVLGR